MGWLFGWRTRKELAEHLIRSNGVTTIKHCFKGNNLWCVQEGMKTDGAPIRFIALYLLKGRNDGRDGWGYKDMDESAGPYYYNCPLAYLDMVSDPGGYATAWRAKVREYWAKANQKLTEGQRIRLYGKEYKVGKPRLKGGYTVWDYAMDYAMPKRMPKRMLKDVEVLA